MKICNEKIQTPPYDQATFLSKLFFAWVTPLFIKSFRRPLNENEIFDISYYDTSEFLTKAMQIRWDREVSGGDPSLTKVVVAIFWKKYLFLGVILFIEVLLNLTQPIIIWRLLLSVKTIHEDLTTSIIYATLLLILVALIIVLRNPYYFQCLRMGMQVKVGISGLIYRKMLRLNQKALGRTTTGQIINLLSNDVQRFEMGLPHLHFVWIGPIVTVVSVMMLYVLSKEGGLAAIIIFLVLIPLQISLGSIYNVLRKKVAVITDDRIKMVSELINGIRVVKMYCWEPMFKRVIGELRRKILFYGMLRKLTKSLWVTLRFSGGRLIVLAVLVVITFRRLDTSLQSIWVTVIFINQIRSTIIDRFSLGVTHFVDFNISLGRVQTFLTLSELSDESRVNLVTQATVSPLDDFGEKREINVVFDKVSAYWNDDNVDQIALNNVSFHLNSPQVCAVIGEVGSGKSSILMAILGELPLHSGKIRVSGKISYCSQQPWVFSGSIEDNILFNTDLNETSFREILQATTMDQDITMMARGLNTTVGERGVSLSGGQKARLSLARAAYRLADIILLDDPLAAVDTQVGYKIYSDCVAGLFKNKIVILVTHHTHLLEFVDNIIVMKNGCVLTSGTMSEIKKTGLDVHSLLGCEEEDDVLRMTNVLIRDSAYPLNPDEKERSVGNSNLSNQYIKTLTNDTVPLLLSIPSSQTTEVGINMTTVYPVNKEVFKIDRLEGYASGTVGFQIYWTYFTVGCPAVVVLIVMGLYMVTMTIYISCDIWLSWWTQELDKRNSSSSNFYKDDRHYLMVLTALSLLTFVLGLLSVIALFAICISSSKVLHDQMMNSILNSRLSFFDITPAGRILNRFSKDIGIVDDLMPVTLQDFILASCLVLFGVGISLYKNVWCIIVIVPLFILFMFMRRGYLNMSRTIKRIEAATRSPLFDHVSNTLHGLGTIRALKNQIWFIDNFYKKQDRHSKAFFLYISASRWFAFRLDEVCLVFIVTVTYSCLALLYYQRITTSDFGLLLTYIIGFIGLTQWAVRQSTEVENQMISVERIREYSQLESELDTSFAYKDKTSPTWPNIGKIGFEDVTLFYEDGGPLILNEVNIIIEDKEKIGIVGRTGAGKSSLISALFRLVELPPNCGRIFIDGQDICLMELSKLRNSIAVIPQDPVMFMGNIRLNLDPFSEYDDKQLWKALETVELKETIHGLPNKLYSAISEGGSNLSVGQRQLICMARALLKKTRIIVIDEATANVDHRTDKLIQRTLKTTFVDCTVLTIAHRLNTIIDSDKILVMSNGCVEEFDHPHVLLTEHPNAIFSQLVQQTGSTEESRLRKVAETNFNTRKQ